MLANLCPALAGEPGAQPTRGPLLAERVRRADDFYLGRANLENVRIGLSLLAEEVASNPNDYEAWWRISKLNCYLARLATGSERNRLLEAAIAAGKKSVALEPGRVEGHFWLGANYGLTAEARGFPRGLFLLDDIRRELEAADRLDPDYEQAGALRTLARVDYRAPFFKGGDKRRSVARLNECLRRFPQNSLAMLYLADSLIALGRRAEARKFLDQILTVCPDPAYGPELAENKAKARARLEKYFSAVP